MLAVRADCRLELGVGDAHLSQLVVVDDPAFHELRGLALRGSAQTATAHDREREGEVGDEERHRADPRAGDRVVVADDAVLHGVRDRQQDDEVERAELRELALAREAKRDHQEQVDEEGAQDLL